MIIHKSKADRVFDAINVFLMCAFMLVMLYPLYFIVIASLSEPYAVAKGAVRFWIKDFSLEAYANTFANHRIWIGYRNTLVYTFFGVLFNLLLTIPSAYVLSKKNLPLGRVCMLFLIVTMYFSGGMVPSYLLMKNLNLLDSPAAIVLMNGLSVSNIIVTRSFFASTIPGELYESAHIDGANEYQTFFVIALPLSGAILAVISLFFAVARWNAYMSALLYISDPNLYPLQLILRSILIQNEQSFNEIMLSSTSASEIEEALRKTYVAEGMKYSLIFIASAPLLIAYPFVQKFFVRGVTAGAIKG